MPNMSPKKNEMPTQAPEVRAHNFNEVATGYSEETALDEALRCLNCPKMPCVSGCPVNIHIPEFIAKIRENDFEGAYQVIQQTSSLPQSAAGYVLRNSSAKASAFAASKANPSASADLNALLQIGTMHIPPKLPKLRLPTATALQL